MSYTPELNTNYSATLRRLAWAANQPMTKTLDEIIDFVSNSVKKTVICDSCRDKTICKTCHFNGGLKHEISN